MKNKLNKNHLKIYFEYQCILFDQNQAVKSGGNNNTVFHIVFGNVMNRNPRSNLRHYNACCK